MNQAILENKKKQVERLNSELADAKCAVIVTYHNLSVTSINQLRKDLKKSGGKMEVAKNTLMKRAFDAKHFEKLESLLKGPNALITCKDPTAVLPALSKFVSKNKAMEIKGAIIEGTFCDANKTMMLATAGSKENVISMLLSALESPLIHFALACKAVGEAK